MNDMKSPREEEFAALLEGREARRDLQKELLGEHAWVLQICLNLPGLPKHLSGDFECLGMAEKALLRSLPPLAAASRRFCDNGAGKALLFGGSRPSSREVKKACIALEEELSWGRLLDLDVISSEGGLSRSELGLPPRQCLLCREEAKICARRGSHGFEELRLRAEELLALALTGASPHAGKSSP